MTKQTNIKKSSWFKSVIIAAAMAVSLSGCCIHILDPDDPNVIDLDGDGCADIVLAVSVKSPCIADVMSLLAK